MKTIVVSGARSKVGKTSLAIELEAIFPGSRYVKIGGCSGGMDGSSQTPSGRHRCSGSCTRTCGVKPDGPKLYPRGTSFEQILRETDSADFLIIESNAILREMTPDVCLYLDGAPPKPSAALARSKADIVSHARVDEAQIVAVAEKLDIPLRVARRMAWLTGARPEPAAAIVLIGGRSSRMGSDKSLIPIDGEPAAVRLYHALAPHFDHVFFSAAKNQVTPVPGVRMVYDSISGSGPLSGLASSLGASPCRVNFVIACDIPEINVPLMRKLLSFLEEYDIAVPTLTPDTIDPLFGAYDRGVGMSARRLIDAGITKILDVFPLHKARIITTADNAWYANLNTPEDVRRYHQMRKQSVRTDDSIQKIESVERSDLGNPE